MDALPKLISDDPIAIRQEIIGAYEAATNKQLYPAQADNFVLNELAYREALTKSQFNSAMLQNFVGTATGVFLDALGAFWGVKRLPDETDERLRIRIFLAPEALSTAGTRGAYEFHIRSVDPLISYVGFTNPDAGSGTVRTYILTDDGLPSAELLAAIYAKLTSEEICVLGITYECFAPEVVIYQVKAGVIVLRGYDLQVVKAAINKVLQEFVASLKLTLGADIVPSQFNRVIQSVSGVHSVTMIEPKLDFPLDESEWAVNTLIDINVSEQVDG